MIIMVTICPCPPPAQRKIPFQLSIKAGTPGGPIVGAATYTNLVLVDALDVNILYVNNTPETVQASQFTLNTTNGKLSRFKADGVTPNVWQDGDVLLINYAKLGIAGNGITTLLNGAPHTIFLSTDGSYTLNQGYMIYRISIKPTAADTVRIGTSLGGDDIMADKVMTPNVYNSNGVTVDIFADGASQTIYFTGFTAQAQINIYLLPI